MSNQTDNQNDLNQNNTEELSMKQRLIKTTIPAFIVMLLGMFGMHATEHSATFHLYSAYIQWILTSYVLWVGAVPFFIYGFKGVPWHRLNMFSLVSMGIATSYLVSVWSVLWPSFWQKTLNYQPELSHHPYPMLFFESSAMIVWLVLLGQVLETHVHQKAMQALHALVGLMPRVAHFVNEHGQEQEVLVSALKANDCVRVRAGEKIVADAHVLEGFGHVDESMWSGESVPVHKQLGDLVRAGTILTDGTLLLRVLCEDNQSLLAHMIRSVEQAQKTRPPLLRLVDKVARVFMPIVCVIAILTGLIWLLVGPEPRPYYALLSVLNVLVIACPCGLGLAAPMVMVVAASRAARVGILIQDKDAFERLSQIDTVIFDKTGTLTQGCLQLCSIYQYHLGGIAPCNEQESQHLCALALTLENTSTHPMALAIRDYAHAHQIIKDGAVSSVQWQMGYGVQGLYNGFNLCLGSERLMNQQKVDLSAVDAWTSSRIMDGHSVLYLAHASVLLGVFVFRDNLRPQAQDLILAFKKANIELEILSGDHPLIVKDVAQRLGVKTYHAHMLPQDKLARIVTLQAQGHHVAMVGDGVNDAVALSRANVGISLIQATDIAMQAAHILIHPSDLLNIFRCYALSKRVKFRIYQNLLLAFSYNLVAVVMATGIFYSRFGILLNPMMASAAMSVSSIAVILNALRLRVETPVDRLWSSTK